MDNSRSRLFNWQITKTHTLDPRSNYFAVPITLPTKSACYALMGTGCIAALAAGKL